MKGGGRWGLVGSVEKEEEEVGVIGRKVGGGEGRMRYEKMG